MNTLAKVKPCQLVENGNLEDSTGWTISGGSIANGKFTFSNNASAYSYLKRTLDNVILGHKYYVSLTSSATTGLSVSDVPHYVIRVNGTGSAYNFFVSRTAVGDGETKRISEIATATSSHAGSNITLYIGLYSNVAFSGSASNLLLIDLTELYGEGQEPSTVAEFEADFPADYYDYRTTTERKLILSADGKAITL